MHRASRGWCAGRGGSGLRAERHAGCSWPRRARRDCSHCPVGHGFGVTATWDRNSSRRIGLSRPHDRLKSPPGHVIRIADLSLVEVPATSGGDDQTLPILSPATEAGGFDKRLAAGLSMQGVPVVGWSSLDYYWTPRARRCRGRSDADHRALHDGLAPIARPHRRLFIRGRRGAVSRQPSTGVDQAHVAALTLLGPATTASFEFHVTDWLAGAVTRGSRSAGDRALISTRDLCWRRRSRLHLPRHQRGARAGRVGRARASLQR